MAAPVSGGRMQPQIAIKVSGLSKRYEKAAVLANDAIDLEIARGSITAVLGPNGAGKTTLVRQLTGDGVRA